MLKKVVLFSFILLIGLAVFTHFKLAQLKDHYIVFQDDHYDLVADKPSHYLSLKRIGKKVVNTVRLSEDWAFYQHAGVDLQQLQLVLSEALETGHIERGASTLTQQLVKNVYLSAEKTILRKTIEIVLSLWLEKILTKDQILTHYFNMAHWGEGIYGVGPASRYYFKKSPRQLNWRQAIFLANLLPSPVRYAESFKKRNLTDFMLAQEKELLYKLKIAKFIDLDQMNEIPIKEVIFP